MVRLLMLSGLILLLGAPPASAGVREKILRECQEGRITGHYTPGQLRDARKNIPTDIDEYSDCRDVLARAVLAGRGGGRAGGAGGGAGGGGGGGAGGGSAAPGGVIPGGDPASVLEPYGADERAALKKVRDQPSAVTMGGDRIVPGATGLAADAARHGLPTTLLTVLILLALCALTAAFPAVRRRVIARRKP
jgi:hypothetical protein